MEIPELKNIMNEMKKARERISIKLDQAEGKNLWNRRQSFEIIQSEKNKKKMKKSEEHLHEL